MPQKTILVIEDDELNLKLLREILRVGDYRALEAGDAETGIQMAHDHKPDLILMDIHLPKMDGLSATRFIVNDDELKKIPVVALTALAMPEDKVKAFDAGCVDYITKPFQVQSLLESLSKWFGADAGTDRHNIRSQEGDGVEAGAHGRHTCPEEEK